MKWICLGKPLGVKQSILMQNGKTQFQINSKLTVINLLSKSYTSNSLHADKWCLG